jgi:hypothetical protein
MMLARRQKALRKTQLSVLIIVFLPCLFPVPGNAGGHVSTNVPLDHWSYDAVDKLIGQGLIDGSMMTSKPVSRLEMARHVAEADGTFQMLNSKNKIIFGIIERLKEELKQELSSIGSIDGEPSHNCLKPIEDPYIKYVYARHTPDIENIRGDQFDAQSNLRAGFTTRGQLFDAVAFYLHPEYPWSSHESNQDVELIEGYVKLSYRKLELEVGKDSLWWGPGQHGSLLMSNNAEPFKMIKLSTPAPVQLPWIFRSLGPFKFVWFLTELEEDRTVPEPELTGIRLNFKPHPAVEIGLSRAIIFGGEGRPGIGFRDYFDILFSTQGNRTGRLESDELGGLDASLLLPIEQFLPAKSVKLYFDGIGEDEAGGIPSNWGKLFGAKIYDIFKTGRTDLTLEYANNHISGKPNVFYTHGTFSPGYFYKDRVIGHFMGTDSEDLFVRLTHYLNPDVILGLQYDREKSNLSSSPQPIVERAQFDITLFTSRDWRINAAYRFESTKNTDAADNHILFFQLTYDF